MKHLPGGNFCVFSGVRLVSPMGWPDEVWTWSERIPIRFTNFFSPSFISSKNNRRFPFVYFDETGREELSSSRVAEEVDRKDWAFF